MASLAAPFIESNRLLLRMAEASEAALLVDYYQRNKNHLKLYEPQRSAEFYRQEYWQHQLELSKYEFINQRSVKLCLFLPDQARVVGVCNFSNLVMGVFKACNLGYSIDSDYQGQGYMKEALTTAIRYMFENRGFHRVMANYLPYNSRSGLLLKSLGFRREGLAKDYLHINGRWQDHVLTALVNQ